MRVKLVNADGGWQYKNIPRLDYRICFAIMPRLSANWMTEPDVSVAIQVRKRTFELWGRNENGIYEYQEVVE